MRPLQDQVAVVTGAGQGIGAEVARRLARDGATVALLDLDGRSRPVADEIDHAGGSAVSLDCDVSDPVQVRLAVDRVVSECGHLDVLVNNAGITRDNLIFKMSDEEWLSVLSTHLTGTFLMCRAAQRHMVERRAGRIINVSSRSALGNVGQVNYSAAKAGIQGLTATLALELGRFGVTVNAVAPGYIATDMTAEAARRAGVSPSEHQDRAAAGIPLRRVGQASDVAAVVAFFAGPDSAFVSGQTLLVSGGAR
jgi:3-oxoacyl-[acyl-carrier protein] reductase